MWNWTLEIGEVMQSLEVLEWCSGSVKYSKFRNGWVE